jgi:hypothetical protein
MLANKFSLDGFRFLLMNKTVPEKDRRRRPDNTIAKKKMIKVRE